MIEPLSALSLAGTIIQFIDFGHKLVSGGVGIYKSRTGSTDENAELETITKDLRNICEGLIVGRSAALSCASEETIKQTQALADLALMCQQVGDGLTKVLDGIKLDGTKNRKRASFEAAVKGAWKRNELRDLSFRLQKIQTQLNIRLLALINSKQTSTLGLFQALSKHFEDSEIDRTAKAEALNTKIDSVKQTLTSLPSNQDLESLQLRVESIVQDWHLLSLEASVLDSLMFEGMRSREARIDKEHPNTFTWAFDSRRQNEFDADRTDFIDWLKYGSELYWVTGKPGSGKSTLMKYLFDNVSTLQALTEWAAGKNLVVERHFFWNGGSPMLRSQEGLLRTLLYGILRQSPDLIWTIIPKPNGLDERQSPRNITSRPSYRSSLKEWNLKNLAEALNRLKTQNRSSKFCFFIDGLDEYEGDHKELVDVLTGCMSSVDIKLCVSSRPWNIFEEEFKKWPRIRMENFTKNDMKMFIRHRLEEDPRFMKLKDQDLRYGDLVETISERANGVFLWVFLVVRSLREGLPNRDTVAVFRRRLDEIPNDLQSFFVQILNSVDHVYHEEAAKLFRVCLVSRNAPRLMILDSIMQSAEISQEVDYTALQEIEIDEFCENLSVQIKARCKGLLEITFNGRKSSGAPQWRNCRVSFLHKTVKDFLETKDMHHWLEQRTKTRFDPMECLVSATVTGLQRFEYSIPPYEKSLWIEEFVDYARILETRPGTTAVINYCEYLEPTICRQWLGPYFENSKLQWMLSLAIRKGLRTYVRSKFEAEKGSFKKPVFDVNDSFEFNKSLPLQAVVGWGDDSILDYGQMCLDMVELLLELNANPNQRCDERTVWQWFLETCNEHGILMGLEDCSHVIKLFLQYGADPNVEFTVPLEVVSFASSSDVPQTSTGLFSLTPGMIGNYFVRNSNGKAPIDELLPKICPPRHLSHIRGILYQKRADLRVHGPPG